MQTGQRISHRPFPARGWTVTWATLLFLGALAVAGCGNSDGNGPGIADGGQVFRHDTFGSERFWTDTLRMHEVIQSGVSPKTALAVGLKVDADALPPGILGAADLDDPATTVELIRLGAVMKVPKRSSSNKRGYN